ncbi:MAG: histidinol dehydrogenase [Myxococcales bacterium]|nr:histidinol dehydrogenase [Myxococcales bacterium]
MLRQISVPEVPSLRRHAIDAQTLTQAAEIVEQVRQGGEQALRQMAERFGDIAPSQPMIFDRAALEATLQSISEKDRALLERSVARVRTFAEAQRASLQPTRTAIPGGWAGQEIAPVDRAGCYAPGGRFPLPSSVIMTVVTARAAGVSEVWVASPKPTPITLAAAALSGADALLAVGGAQAIAALAYGAGTIPPCDAIVGPGNRWVTAAKQLVSGHVAIDMLAGPSELVVIADTSAHPATVAADLLGQAEHDTDAIPILISLDQGLIDETQKELQRQLETLPTAEIARKALENGYAVLAKDRQEAFQLADQLAPEHLELSIEDAASAMPHLKHYGALFVGHASAEVLGDYCAGPNHTLPTGGTARSAGGLSVHHFLRIRTWMQIDDLAAAQPLVQDAIDLAHHEGLEAHARSAQKRLLSQ